MAAVTRDQVGTPPALQPRGPGSVRSQTVPPVLRARGASILTYRMRGIVSGAFVYWNALKNDSASEYYTPAPGTATDVVVVKIMGVGL